MRKMVLGIASLLLAFNLWGQSGEVFVDANANGVRDKGEKGLAGVVVSDGFSLVKSDQKGRFSLELAGRSRFVTLYTPSGYRHTTPFYVDVRGGAEDPWSFGLVEADDYMGEFIQLSDIEERRYLDWMDDFKDYIGVRRVDFVAVTGDICYEQGLKINGEEFNTDDLGVRMVYTLGNHDLLKGFKDSQGLDYGEKPYEDQFGPAWYSFNIKGVHYVVTPMLSGDAKPSYSPDDIYRWMAADLESIPEGTPVVIFNHGVLGNTEHLLLKGESIELDLSDYNVIGYIYGHNHVNYHYVNDNGTQMICTIAPNKGGNDHSQSSWRHFKVDGGVLTNELHYYPIPKHIAANGRVVGDSVEVTAVVYDGKSDVESVKLMQGLSAVNMARINDFEWRGVVRNSDGKLKVGVLFSDSEVRLESVKFQKGLVWQSHLRGLGGLGTPIVSEDVLYVPLVDDAMSRNCGVVAIDKGSGEEVWYYKTRGSVRNNMVMAEGLLFVSDVTSQIYALDPATGREVWRYKFRKDGMHPCNSQGVCYADGMLYVGQGLHLTALKAKDGSVVWRNTTVRNTGITDVSTYAVADGVLCVNAYWVARYGFDAATGELLWQKSDPETRYSTGTPVYHDGKWYYTAYQSLVEMDPRSGVESKMVKQGHIFNTRSKMLIKDGVVVVGTSNHGMTGYKFEDFSQIWNTTTMPALIYTSPYTKSFEMSVEGDPVLYGDSVIYGANDGYVYCSTIDKGAYVWRYEMGLPVLANPVVDGEYLYVVDMGGKLVKLSLNDL